MNGNCFITKLQNVLTYAGLGAIILAMILSISATIGILYNNFTFHKEYEIPMGMEFDFTTLLFMLLLLAASITVLIVFIIMLVNYIRKGEL